MATFPTYGTWDDCVKHYNVLKNSVGFADTSLHTNIPTCFRDVKDMVPYMQKIADANTPGERSAVVNDYTGPTLKDMAPRIVGLWLLNTNFWNAAQRFFYNTNIPLEIIDLAKKSNTVADTKEHELRLYNETTLRFRTESREWLEDAIHSFAMKNVM